MAETALVTGAIGGGAGIGIGDEADFSVFENKSGLAEDLKFLASMPELCDVRINTNLLLSVNLKACLMCTQILSGDVPRWRHS